MYSMYVYKYGYVTGPENADNVSTRIKIYSLMDITATLYTILTFLMLDKKL